MTSDTAPKTLTRRHALASGISVAPRDGPREHGIVHLGAGNFHRAHQAVYTAHALDIEDGPWGVAPVVRRNRAVARALDVQGGAYTVLSVGSGPARAEIVQLHGRVVVARDEPLAVLSLIASPATRIVSLTVTESGYTLKRSGGLDLDHPAVRADLTLAEAPRTAIGQLFAGMRGRHRNGGSPLTVVSCDNVPRNGHVMSRLMSEFAEAALCGAELTDFTEWLASGVAFTNSMVDRVVPRTTDAHRRLARDLTGLKDSVPVAAEEYSTWVMDDHFAAGRPAWEKAGVIFSEEVELYEAMKIRMLNGTNSLLAYLGLLAGHRTIDQSISDPEFEAAARLYLAEAGSELFPPRGISLDQYAEDLIGRFRNEAIAHATTQVASDGSEKVPTRIADTVRARSLRGEASPMAALLVAAYLQVMCQSGGMTSPSGLSDPRADVLAMLGDRYPRAEDLVCVAFATPVLFPESLAENQAFQAEVLDALATLRAGGLTPVTAGG
jgi:fructuronate reductase